MRHTHTHNTPYTTPSLLLSSHLSESSLREFRSRGTQEGHRQRRSSPNYTSTRVREIVGGSDGLSAFFSACTSTDAYSVVSVRDFLCLFRIRV